MTNYSIWRYTEIDLTALANQAKEQILFALANEGLLNGDPEEIAREYVIVLHKKGWFGSLWDRFRKTDKDGTFFAVLKSVSYAVPRGIGKEKSKASVTHLKVVPKKDE